jgi:putative peptide zinc metalloprotease protein
MRKLSAAAVTVLVLALALATGASAHEHSKDNTAVAVNTRDDASVFDFAFDIQDVSGDVVDQKNIAFAYASCTDCHTTAIAIEIVLVTGSPSTYTPTNEAIAVNYECTRCQTYATAYQFVVQNPTPEHFTHDALKQIHDIRNDIRDLRKQDLDPFQLQAAIDPLIDQLKQVIATGLVAGPPHGDENDGEDTSDGPVPAGHAQPATSSGPEATVTAAGSGSETSQETTQPVATTG